MKTLKIGIAGYDQMKARTMAIARGEHTPERGEPKVWFTSIESFAKLLSEHNRRLLELIARERPRSLTELAALAGRSKSNLSRTLKTMSPIRARGIAAGRAWYAGAAGSLRSGEARCLVDGDEEWVGRCQPVTARRTGALANFLRPAVLREIGGGLRAVNSENGKE